MGTLDGNRAAALAWVNEMRAKVLSLPPLEELRPGRPNTTDDCALGRSLDRRFHFVNGGSFGSDDPLLNGDGQRGVLPWAVRTFEHDFERGFYPDLMAEGAKPSEYWGQVKEVRATAEDSPLALA